MTTLYKVTNTGVIQEWSIYEYGNDKIEIEYGQKEGNKQCKYETVKINQSGRSLAEQMFLRIDSRINKQLDKGYCYSIEEAKASIGTNASKMPKPMLAQKLIDRPEIDYKKCFIQYKYNGHRCLIAGTDEGIIAYSRNGKTINTINHIIDGLDLKPGTILDGELYIHGKKLQEISSVVRKVQPDNFHLTFVAYDVVINKPYSERLDRLMNTDLSNNMIIAPTRCGDTVDLQDALNESLSSGYEGLILRTDDKGYEVGKRSKSLLKLKQHFEDEFMVIDIHESADGWAILECLVDLNSDKKFKVTAPGTIIEKTEILHNKEHYIGSLVNVEYFEITKDGIPFHPVAKFFREEE